MNEERVRDDAEREKRLVAAAAAKHEVEQEALLACKVFADKVVIILPTGQKVTYHYADLVGFFTGAEAEAEAKAEAETVEAEPEPVNVRKAGRKPA